MSFFKTDKPVFKTHRALDIGALGVAKALKTLTQWPLIYSETSRLVIDLNRSLDNRTLFSSYLHSISPSAKEKIIKKHYLPYRKKVENFIDHKIKTGGQIVHLGMHSFTPRLHGKTRPMDLAVLFDPKRKLEVELANKIVAHFKKVFPDFKITRNQPYRGNADGLGTALRKKYPAGKLLTLEIEINQKHLVGKSAKKNQQAFAQALAFTELLGPT